MIARRHSARIALGGAAILALACVAAVLPPHVHGHVHGAIERMTAVTVASAMMLLSVFIPLGFTWPAWRRWPRLALTLWLAIPAGAALLIHGATREAAEWATLAILALLWLAFFIVVSIQILWAALGGPAALVLDLGELLCSFGRWGYQAARDIYRSERQAKRPSRAYWALGLGCAAVMSMVIALSFSMEVRMVGAAVSVSVSLAAGLLLLSLRREG